jgi:hypothetical protein
VKRKVQREVQQEAINFKTEYPYFVIFGRIITVSPFKIQTNIARASLDMQIIIYIGGA